jgi:hypothetical protein
VVTFTTKEEAYGRLILWLHIYIGDAIMNLGDVIRKKTKVTCEIW